MADLAALVARLATGSSATVAPRARAGAVATEVTNLTAVVACAIISVSLGAVALQVTSATAGVASLLTARRTTRRCHRAIA